jgi:hypothetical protein
MEKFDKLLWQRVLWHEAKGKLNAIIELTYDKDYERLQTLFNDFITKVEGDSPIA